MSDFDLLEACRTRCEELEAKLSVAIERAVDLERALRSVRYDLDAILRSGPGAPEIRAEIERLLGEPLELVRRRRS